MCFYDILVFPNYEIYKFFLFFGIQVGENAFTWFSVTVLVHGNYCPCIYVKTLTITKKDVKNDKNEKKPLQRIIDLFIDLMGLRLILFDVLDFFQIRGSNLMLSTKNFGSTGILGSSMMSSKP